MSTTSGYLIKENNKLLKFLRSLNQQEWKRLEDYVQSPIFNTNQRVIQLLFLLKPYYPTFTNICKESLFQELFPDKRVYKDNMVRSFLSILSKLVEDFLSFLRYEQQKEYQQLWAIDAMVERQLVDLADKKRKQFKGSLSARKIKDISYCYFQFQLAEMDYQFTTISDNRAVESNLQEVIGYLDRHYLANKLYYAWVALNRQNVVKSNYDHGLFFDQILRLFDEPLYEDIPLLPIYYELVMLLLRPDSEAYFFNLLGLLKKHSEEIELHEKRQFYTVLINHCRIKMVRGNDAYKNTALEIYQIMLDEKLLFVKEYISPHHFKNIVTLGINIGQYDWTEKFINQYEASVHPRYRKTVYRLNKARWYFAQKSYEEATDMLRSIYYGDVEFIDVYYDINYKVLLIKSYYEIEEIDALLAALEAFRIFLRRNKAIEANHGVGYNNFIKQVKKLINKREGKKRSTKNLTEEMNSIAPLFQRDWLVEKAILLD